MVVVDGIQFPNYNIRSIVLVEFILRKIPLNKFQTRFLRVNFEDNLTKRYYS